MLPGGGQNSPIENSCSKMKSWTRPSVFICEGSHSKVTPTEGLKWQKCIASQFWTLDVQDQGVSSAGSLGLWGNIPDFLLLSGGLLAVFDIPWLISDCMFVWRSPWVHVYVQISSLYQNTSHIGLGAHPISVWPQFDQFHLQWLYFQTKSQSEILGSGGLDFKLILEAHNLAHNTIIYAICELYCFII